MKKTTYLICMLTVLFLACKNDKKEEKQKKEKELEKSVLRRINNEADFTDHFVVILEVLAEKGDSFQVFYTEDYLLNFSEDKMITTSFNGSENYQTLIFDLPKDIYPDRYRFDVGGNPDQKQLKIKSLTIKYGKREIFIPENLIPQYLEPNIYIDYNSANNTYLLNTLDSTEYLPYDPFFTCSPELVRMLMDL